MKKYFVYMLATCRNGALCWDVTSNLIHRTWQHRAGQIPFSQIRGDHSASLLVWFEEHPDLRTTLRRLQQIDRAPHAWKLRLIQETNPAWNDLYDALLPAHQPARAA